MDCAAFPMMCEYDENNEPYSFDDWERNAPIDGWLCRSDTDCEWLDSHLGCDDNEFEMSSVQVWHILEYNLSLYNCIKLWYDTGC